MTTHLLKFNILFDKNGNPIDIPSIKRELSNFPESYYRVVRAIINKSISLDKDIFIFQTDPFFTKAILDELQAYGLIWTL